VRSTEPIVLVVDDDESVREALASLIGSAGLLVECFASPAEFLRRRKSDAPSCLVLDVRMPGLSGLDLQHRLAHTEHRIPIIFITAHGDIPMAVRAMKDGAVEFLPKPFRDEDLLNAIREALDRDSATRARRAEILGIRSRYTRLTPRQIEVLALLARGRSNKMIARELDCAEATVKTHLTTIFKALNVASRGEASAAAARMERVRETQVARAIDGQVSLGRLLANMESQRFRAGEVLFRKGDASGELFYVEKGTVTLSELGIELGAGSVLGEIGLFSPGHRRTSTAVCKTECEMRTVCAADAIRLYYQEPEFALHLLRLIVGRLQADKLREG